MLLALAWIRLGGPHAWIASAPGWVQSAAAAIGADAGDAEEGRAARPDAAVPVSVAQVTIRNVPVEFRSVGTIEAVESVSIRARVDGLVDKILVDDGALVKAGDVLVELDDKPIQAQIDQQEANVRRDRAQLENARLTLNRTADLAKRGNAAKQSLDDATTNVEALAAGLAASEAQLRSLELEFSYHQVKAPFDGRIGRVQVSLGALVRGSDTGSTIGTLNQIDPIYVALGVPQNLLGDLAAAEAAGTARIEVPLPGSEVAVGTPQVREGPVTMVENAVERGTGLVTVRARIKNDDQRLWPGTVLDARLVLRDEPDALVVPSDAIQISQTGSFVFVVDRDNKARVVPVTIARAIGDYTMLAEGPPAGTTVVTDGQIRLVEGTSVHIQQSEQGLEARR